jgi:hypothetical protein
MDVTLSNGGVVTLPDNADDATRQDLLNQAEAAAKGATGQNANQLLPATSPLFPRDQYPGINAAIDWTRANILQSQAGNFVGNVTADIAAMPWDIPAGISNAITHTAKNYGYGMNKEDVPLIGPRLKHDLSITPLTDPWAQRAETAATIATTGGGSFWPRVVSGILGEAKGEIGSYLGGKIADATDPRLREALQTGGAITAGGAPVEKIAAPVVRKLFANPSAPNAYDAAKTVQGATGASTPPITAGQLGGNFLQTIEGWLGRVPIVGAPIHAAQGNVEKQIEQTRDTAAQTVAGPNATVDGSPSAPGVALLNGVRAAVNDAMSTAKPQIDAIENQLGTQNVRGPGGGSAMVDVRGLTNDLQSLKTATDANGNVRNIVAPEIAAQIDAEIASINKARQPENAAFDAWMQGNINRAQTALNDPSTPAAAKPMLQAQLQQAQAARDANLKVPFEALRQMKTLQGAETFGDGTPTLNGRMNGKVYDAYGGALQGFASNLDPALGAKYAKATGGYSGAMNLQRDFKNITQGANENQLTSLMTSGLKGPESIRALAKMPEVWKQAAASTIAMLGRTPRGAFDPDLFARQWNSATNEAKDLYTQGAPGMRKALDAAATLGSGFRPTTHPGVATTSGIIGAEVFSKLLDHMFGEGTGLAGQAAVIGAPTALSAGIESPATMRMLAGRPAPFTFQQHLPAILAVTQAQGRNLGY